MPKPTILLTGASGFIGRHVAVALDAAALRVRALSRNPQRHRLKAPELDWLEGDLESRASREALLRALDGVTAAVYLHHAVGRGPDYAEREAEAARRFVRAADEAGVERIVYLGGVVPSGAGSKHLESRRFTGEVLRQGKATTIELRASMVIGHASASFSLVRDLAVNLPILALPPWLDQSSCPVSICDVAPAIALACLIRVEASSSYDLPGPETLTHRQLIEDLTGPLGTRLLDRRFNALTPALAAWGLAVASRVDSALSRELVLGLTGDLSPTGPALWDCLGNPALRPIRHAIVDAISDELQSRSPSDATRRRIATKTVEWLERQGAMTRA